MHNDNALRMPSAFRLTFAALYPELEVDAALHQVDLSLVEPYISSRRGVSYTHAAVDEGVTAFAVSFTSHVHGRLHAPKKLGSNRTPLPSTPTTSEELRSWKVIWRRTEDDNRSVCC